MRRYLRIVGTCVSTGFLSACSMLWTTPDERTLKERFDMLPTGGAPVQAPLRIYWNEHAIPYIEARTDRDAAFGLGLVQAHLRLGQLEMLRIVSQGRMTEVAGPIPFVKTLDHGLRMLNFRQAATTSLASLPTNTRLWLEGFVEGINFYQRRLQQLPLEHRLFGLSAQNFSLLDIMTIGRLASADLNWGLYFRFLKLAEEQDWQAALRILLAKQESDVASFKSRSDFRLIQLIRDLTRSGSNSVAVHGRRSSTGAALLANDPHVGIFLPNFWLLAGLKSPSTHVVGLMIPGLPFFGIGRNPDIAWGGTNMRAISSHLFDVQALPEEAKRTRRERLETRWWFSSEIKIRETDFGPVITDLDYFDPKQQPFEVALKWIGQESSDEIGAFLQAQQARSWEEFVSAFRDYRVSAMNLIYADRKGHIGLLPAYGQAVLQDPSRTLDLVKSIQNPIVGVIPPTELPTIFNPPSGLIASANNKPFDPTPIPLAYAFANNDRHDRMIALLGDRAHIQLSDLMQLQQDVFSDSAFQLKEAIVRRIPSLPGQVFYTSFAEWDGHYRVDSQSAVAFEILMYYAWQDYLKVQDAGVRGFLASYDGWKPLLKAWIDTWDDQRLEYSVRRWLTAGAKDFQAVKNWGDFHRQSIQHPLGAIPWLGHRFKRSEYGEHGSNDTLFKSGRPFSPEPASVTYGASARHISDLSDRDANFFVLKGGQDGWLNSPQLDDQIGLWREGRYIQMPLTMDRVREQFKLFVADFFPENPNP